MEHSTDSHAPKMTRCHPIFVNGIWKSGNHLVYSALNELGIKGPYNGFAAHLLFGRGKLAKRLTRGALPGSGGIDVGLETEAVIRPGYLQHSLRRFSGSIVGGHAAYSDEFLRLLRGESARIIAIRRDPRDILVSFADWIESRPDYFLSKDFRGLTREARVEKLLRGGYGSGYKLRPFTKVLQLAQPWIEANHCALVVSFEDLVGPKGGGSRERQHRTLARMCEHLGLSMQIDQCLIDRVYGGTLTFNQGRSERWLELNSSDLRSEIDENLREHLRLWGYDGDAIKT